MRLLFCGYFFLYCDFLLGSEFSVGNSLTVFCSPRAWLRLWLRDLPIITIETAWTSVLGLFPPGFEGYPRISLHHSAWKSPGLRSSMVTSSVTLCITAAEVSIKQNQNLCFQRYDPKGCILSTGQNHPV